MSDHEPPVTDYGLLALLRFDPARDARPAAKARVFERLESSIAALGGDVPHASSGTVSRSHRASKVDTAPFSPIRAARRHAPMRAMWSLAGKPTAGVIAAFMLGGV